MAVVSHTCNNGMQAIVSAVEGAATTLYISCGTGAGPAAVTDTASNCTEDTATGRVAATLTKTTTTNPNDTITATATLNFAVNEDVTELMLWDAPTGGHLLAHTTGILIAGGAGNALPSGQVVMNIQQAPQ